ncbi:hypothetical protein Acsp04_19720 [Actinomadura sp. NBRC 104425]|nr:hypothetical protein Acsp04_19720 [Actinomadura sp. NBRC 104425]
MNPLEARHLDAAAHMDRAWEDPPVFTAFPRQSRRRPDDRSVITRPVGAVRMEQIDVAPGPPLQLLAEARLRVMSGAPSGDETDQEAITTRSAETDHTEAGSYTIRRT